VTQTIRLLFDDCLSKHAVAALAQLANFSRGQVEIRHLVDFAMGGEDDEHWIPSIPAEGWMIVTADRGKKNKGGKLPIICQRCRITYVLLSAALHTKNTFDRMRAVLAVWPDLLAASADERGCGYLIRIKNQGRGVQLDSIYRPPDASERPKVQLGMGF
jgi:hypothetical protein